MSKYVKTEHGYKSIDSLEAGVGKRGTGEGAEIFNNYDANIASGDHSHAEGNSTTASGHASHAEGNNTTASGNYSHAEGINTTASGDKSHAEGHGDKISLSLTGNANTTTYKVSSNNSNIKIGRVLEYNNTYTEIINYESSTLTITTDKTLDSSNALNNIKVNLVLGIASGHYSHAEGDRTTASGSESHAEGFKTTASGNRSHAEGYSTTASGDYSHTEGYQTTASGMRSHAEGYETTASGNSSHAEGSNTTASGNDSHAEGYSTTASGDSSHAEGNNTTASGANSHAEGYKTTASCDFQHVQGRFNINDVDSDGNPLNTYAHIVGNGESEDARSNAHTLDWDGNAWYAGDVYVGSTSGLNKDEGSKKLATEEYINIRVPAWTDEDEGKVLKIVNGTPTWV